MPGSPSQPPVLSTSVGDYPLQEYRLRVGGREWSLLHTDAVISLRQEADYLQEVRDRLPYGVALWPSAIALAHEIAARAHEFRGRSALELGAGTGLPGIVAASLGARVVQSDGHEVALSLCRRNGERNGARGIEYRRASWSEWDDPARYDWILGSDILYAESTQADLRRIFAANLAPGGRVLLSDPLRAVSHRFLETLEAEGWRVAGSRWTVGEAGEPRPIGLWELTPGPRGA